MATKTGNYGRGNREVIQPKLKGKIGEDSLSLRRKISESKLKIPNQNFYSWLTGKKTNRSAPKKSVSRAQCTANHHSGCLLLPGIQLWATLKECRICAPGQGSPSLVMINHTARTTLHCYSTACHALAALPVMCCTVLNCTSGSFYCTYCTAGTAVCTAL